MERKNYFRWILKDFQNYYNENYKGKTRSELYRKSGGFYEAVRKRGFAEEVFPKIIKSYKKLTLKDFQDYYNENLVGRGRTGVFKEDNSFYHAVRNSGFIDKVFPK